jgi:asparagine synthase (glutamine-hydrolysing)
MLLMRLRLSDLQEPQWRSEGGRWSNGESWIEPANVSALVMEVNDDQAPRVRVCVKECKRDEADSVVLDMEPGEVRLAAGVFGTAPLYLVEKAGELYASWDLTALRPYLRADRLVPRVVARTLTRQHRYTSQTLFEGVYRLTERASATFTTSGLSIHYPEPAEHVLEPRTLRPGVDPLAALDELLTDVIRQVPTATGCVGVELSGGADSGNVALTVNAARFPEVHSFGLLVEAPANSSTSGAGRLWSTAASATRPSPPCGTHPSVQEVCAPCASRTIRREPSTRRRSTSYASR